MPTALIHYWFYARRGGEKVVEQILRIYPGADLYTHLFRPERVADIIRNRKVRTTFINRLPRAEDWYQGYLPLMPGALEHLDLRRYDLVISSESGPTKGVRVHRDALHICYCHSPMRYIWDQQPVYLAQSGLPARLFLKTMTPYLRRWDRQSARRVDHFITNSEHVRKRIRRIYNREATVIHPPVEVDHFQPSSRRGDYFVLVGQLVPYKRPDLAVRAFNLLGLPLKVVGSGPQSAFLKARAGANIEFTGYLDDAELARVLAGARALIFPGEEDFGMVPVEAQAAGVPVIAYGRGGVLESVRGLREEQEWESAENWTGLFFSRPAVSSLVEAVRRFLRLESRFEPAVCRRQVLQFAPEIFRKKFIQCVDLVREQRKRQP